MRFLLGLIFLPFSCLLFGLPVDTSQIRTQYLRAKMLNEQKAPAEAYSIAKEAIQELRKWKQKAPQLEAGLLNILADGSLHINNYSKAIQLYEQARRMLEENKLSNTLEMVESLNKIGNYYLEIKNFEKALEYLDKGLVLGREVLGNRHLQVATLYNNMGNCMYYIGDSDKALDFHNQSLAIREDQLPDPNPQVAQSYNNIGLCLQDKNYLKEALTAYQQALDIYVRYFGKVHPDVADVRLNIGTIYRDIGHPGLFVEYRKALNIYQQTLEKQHPSIGLCYNNLANAYSTQSNYTQASQLYEKALDIRIHNYGEVHPDVAITYFNIGIINYFQGDLLSAMDAFDRCFLALNYVPGISPDFDEVNDHQTLARLFSIIPRIQFGIYENTGDISHLLEAFAYYQQADQLIDFLRTRYETIGSKLQLANTAYEIYDAAIELAQALYGITKEKAYLEQSFKFSEKSKGILLLEALKKTDAENFSGIPQSILLQLEQVETEIGVLEKMHFLESENKASSNPQIVDSLRNLIFEQRQQQDSIISQIKQEYAQYYNLRYETSTLPIEVIQNNLLKPGQTLLEYFLGADHLQIFVVNKFDFQIVSVNLDLAFYGVLDTFNYAIRRFPQVASKDLMKNIEQYARSANVLYQYLIEPVKDIIEDQLMVIPDGALGLVSFGALLSKYPDSLSFFKTYPYLLKDYTLSYNYSATLLKEMIEQENKERLKPYLGLAPKFKQGNTKGLSPLRYNYEEVLGVQNTLGGQILVNEAATKSNFLSQQADYKILHLATHGKANNVAGDYSFLAFSEAASGESPLLYVKDIYSISTNAEMVVLSACETGIGELQEGEGIASIARSFSYAGARSLMATQWSVDDKATNDLVHLFFGNIRQGLSKDQALRDAKLSFIRSNGNKDAHPYFWASLIPIGNMEIIHLSKPIFGLVWWLILPVFLLLFYFLNRLRGQK